MEIFSTKINTEKEMTATRPSWEEYIRPVRKFLQGLVITNRVPGEEGIDMMIIGDDQTKKLTRWAEIIEKKQGRPMNYVIFSKDDFLYRVSVRDKFVTDIMEMEITDVVDPEGIINYKKSRKIKK